MKRIVKLLSVATLMMGMTFCANAQEYLRQAVYINGNIPTGSFASDVNSSTVPLYTTDMGKDASVGFGVGYRASYRFDVGVGLVAPYLQADLLWNTIGSNLNEQYRQAKSQNTPTYFNIPIQFGVSYLYDELWTEITPYAEFGLGTFQRTSWPDTRKYAYKSNFAFCFSLGVGAYFGSHVSAGLYYYGLGTHNIEYTSKTVDNLTTIERAAYDAADVETRNCGSLVLRIGFHF